MMRLVTVAVLLLAGSAWAQENPLKPTTPPPPPKLEREVYINEADRLTARIQGLEAERLQRERETADLRASLQKLNEHYTKVFQAMEQCEVALHPKAPAATPAPPAPVQK